MNKLFIYILILLFFSPLMVLSSDSVYRPTDNASLSKFERINIIETHLEEYSKTIQKTDKLSKVLKTELQSISEEIKQLKKQVQDNRRRIEGLEKQSKELAVKKTP